MGIKWKIAGEQSNSQTRSTNFVQRIARMTPAARKRLNQANEKSAEELAAMMVRLAPKDSGELVRSIRYYEVTGELGASEVGGSIVWRVAVGDQNAWYARLVEFGTAPHSLAKGADSSSGRKDRSGLNSSGAAHPGSRPRPFFYPSVRALRRLIRSRQKRAFTQAVKDTKK